MLSKEVAKVCGTALLCGGPSTDLGVLLGVIDLCVRMEDLCRDRQLSSLCANQVGENWPVFVCYDAGRWRKIACPEYNPTGEGVIRGLVRFPNVEADRARHFLVDFHDEVDAEYFEIEDSGEPKLVKKNERGPLLWLQANADILGGRFPHLRGTEYLVRFRG